MRLAGPNLGAVPMRGAGQPSGSAGTEILGGRVMTPSEEPGLEGRGMTPRTPGCSSALLTCTAFES